MSHPEIHQQSSLELPSPFAPAARPARPTRVPSPSTARPEPARPHRTWQQIFGAVLLAGICVAAAVWYVPQVLRTDRRLLTGSVITSGVSTLNFTSAGEIARLKVHQGEHVRKGQLLATEYAPDTAAVLSADVTAVRSEKAKLAYLRAAVRDARSSGTTGPGTPTPADVSAVQAQIRLDEAQLAADHSRSAASQLIAPAAGTITAANGRPGEAVTTQGIRDYLDDGPRARVTQTPAFSLLPEGPRASTTATPSSSSLPVVALRTSSAWQVATLIPQSEVTRIHVNERVVVGVPSAGVTGIPGWVSEVLSTPVMTSQGDEYQAVVKISGHAATAPLSGMAANVHLDPGTTTSARR